MTLNKINKRNFVPTSDLGATPVFAEKLNTVIDRVNSIASAEGTIALTSTDAGAAGPTLTLTHDSPSPAATDVISSIISKGDDDGGNLTSYAKTNVTLSTVTDGSEAAVYQWYVTDGGSYPTLPNMQLSTTGLNAVIEDNGATGMAIQMTQVSASPAASDAVGLLKYIGRDSAGNAQEYAQLTGLISTPTSGSEEGELQVKLAKTDGTVTEVARFTPTGLTTTQNVGTANTGVTAVEYGDGRNMTTVLTVSQADALTVADNAALADGYLLYTLPAGAVFVNSAYISMGVTLAEDTTATPEVGLGTTAGSGANATLGDVGAGAENILGPATADDCAGTEEVLTQASSLAIEATEDHTIYFNVAATWADTAGTDLTGDIAGTVVINWTFMA